MAKRRLSKRQQERIQSIQEKRREKANAKTLDDKALESLDGLGAETAGRVITNYGSQVDIEMTSSFTGYTWGVLGFEVVVSVLALIALLNRPR